MEWSEEDVVGALKEAIRVDTTEELNLGSEHIRAIMTRAVELAVARGGTMTADHLEHTLKNIGSPMTTGDGLRAHLATQGAQIAVLEAELAKARQSEDVWRKRLESAAVALSAHGAGEVGRLDIAARVRILLDAMARSRQREESIPGHPERAKERSEAVTISLAYAAYRSVDERGRCRHKERWAECARCDGYEEGAEAMRAACWEAVQLQLITEGIHERSITWANVKAAIEGATP